MKYQELQNKTLSELFDMLTEKKKKLFSLRMQKKLDQLTSTAVVRTTRRDAARLIMRINELKQKS